MNSKLPENTNNLVEKLRKDRQKRIDQERATGVSTMTTIKMQLMNEMSKIDLKTLRELAYFIETERQRMREAHMKDTRAFEIQCAHIKGEDWTGFTRPDNTPVLCGYDLDSAIAWDVRGLQFNYINVVNRLKTHDQIFAEAKNHGVTLSGYIYSVMYDPKKKEFHVWYHIKDRDSEYKGVFNCDFELLIAQVAVRSTIVEPYWQTLIRRSL